MRLNPKQPNLRGWAAAGAVYLTSCGALRWRRYRRGHPLVAFATGGAGNQVFPALAVAGDLHNHGVAAVFLAESRGLEVHLAQQSGFPLYCISSIDLQRPLKSVANAFRILQFPFCVAHSAWALVQSAPDVVLGLGGHVSVPACVAALALGIPLLLLEPNAAPGAVTQALHGLSRSTLLAYDTAASGLRHKDRCVVVGPAVRQEVLASGPEGPGPEERQRLRRKAREALGVTGRGARLLVVLGGSQGCRYLNCALNNALPQLAGVPGLHILWQTGTKQYVAYSAGHVASLSSVKCSPFIQDVGTVLAAADLVLSRAGASTVAELLATGTPAVLVPSPACSEEVQAANARVLADTGLVEVLPQGEVDDRGLAPRLLPLLAPDGKRLAAMRARWAAAVAAGDVTGAGSGGGAQAAPAGAALDGSPCGGLRCGLCRPGRASVACIRDEVLKHIGRVGR